MFSKQRPASSTSARSPRRTFLRSTGLALVVGPALAALASGTAHACTPPPELPADVYAILVQRYRPIEEQTKTWIASLNGQTIQFLGFQAYRFLLEEYHICWPIPPLVFPPPPFKPYEKDLAGFAEMASSTIAWAEAADKDILPGILAITTLLDDLNAALGPTPQPAKPFLSSALGPTPQLAAGQRERLWRPWPC